MINSSLYSNLATKSCILLLVLIFSELSSQNLIPNASFEVVKKFDKKWSGSYKDFNWKIKSWNSPTQASPDLIFDKFKDEMKPLRPHLNLKEILPNDGRLMVGIKAYGCNNNSLHCKEYIQVRLEKELIKDSCYNFSMWYNYPENSININKLDISFSDTLISEYTIQSQLYVSESNALELKLNKPNEWQRTASSFTPNQNYKYLIIGSFTEDQNLTHFSQSDSLKYAYYLIDNLELYEVNCATKEIKDSRSKIVLNEMAFDFDKSNLNQSGNEILNNYFSTIELAKIKNIEVLGWTDKSGSDDYNFQLSQKRAEYIREKLIELGIDPAIINSEGKGKSKEDLRFVEIRIKLE